MKLEKLLFDVVDEQPRRYDFYGRVREWEVPLSLTDDELQAGRYEPIYNVLYPLPEQFAVPRDFRDRLNNMTIVRVENEEYGLALTGCGMDFTWEICESYMRLGYYPPASMCRLPQMAGRGSSKLDKTIIAACLASVDAATTRLRFTREHLRRM
jgi:hypothetical protein